MNSKKSNFINIVSNFFQLNNFFIPQGLSSNVILQENGREIYTKKIKNEIKKINDNETSFQIKHLSVMVIGKSGVGKSTLINSILKLYPKSDKAAKEGVGGKITEYTKDHMGESNPFFRLIDTVRIKIDKKFGLDPVIKICTVDIKKQQQSGDMNKFIHCI